MRTRSCLDVTLLFSSAAVLLGCTPDVTSSSDGSGSGRDSSVLDMGNSQEASVADVSIYDHVGDFDGGTAQDAVSSGDASDAAVANDAGEAPDASDAAAPIDATVVGDATPGTDASDAAASTDATTGSDSASPEDAATIQDDASIVDASSGDANEDAGAASPLCVVEPWAGGTCLGDLSYLEYTNLGGGQSCVPVKFCLSDGAQVAIRVSDRQCRNQTVFAPGANEITSQAAVCDYDLIGPFGVQEDGLYTLMLEPVGGLPFNENLHVGLFELTAQNSMDVVVDGTQYSQYIWPGNQLSVFYFDALAGQRVSAYLTTPSYGFYATLVSPSGHHFQHVESYWHDGFLDVIELEEDGTYTLLVDPGIDQSGTFRATLYDVPEDLLVDAIIDGPPAEMPFVSPGQNGAFEFDAVENRTVRFELTSATGCWVYWIQTPSGAELMTPLRSCRLSIREEVLLPETGTYTVFVDPELTNVFTVSLSLKSPPPDVEVWAVTDGPAVTTGPLESGQNLLIFFEASSGQRISYTVESSMGCYRNILTAPSGTELQNRSECNDSTIDAIVLDESGTYAIKVDPTSANTPTITVTVYIVPDDPRTTVALDGSATSLQITVPGQSAWFGIDVVAGQGVSMLLEPSAGCMTFRFLSPTGTEVFRQQTCDPLLRTGRQLAESGVYWVEANPADAAVPTVTLNAWLLPNEDPSAVSNIDGTTLQLELQPPGVYGYVTFNGSAGQRISYLVTISTGCMIEGLYSPSDVTLNSSNTCDDAFSNSIVLEEDGVHTIEVIPRSTTGPTAMVAVYDVPPDVEATTTLPGTVTGLTTTVPGQDHRVKFEAAAGQSAGVLVGPLGCRNARLLDPDGLWVRSTMDTCYNPFELAAEQLTKTGTYIWVVDHVDDSVGALDITVTGG